ncbi:hypothetical protein VTO42DRAFT_5901 [Malbranchea cinnamomea]
MGRLLRTDFSDAPTMLLSPQQTSHPSSSSNQSSPFRVQSSDPSQLSSFNPGRSSNQTSSTTLLPSGPLKNGFANFSGSCAPASSSTPLFANPSRKRSHSEFVSSSEGDGSSSSSLPSELGPAQEKKPIYGEGMTLLNPRTGVCISAESQSMEAQAAAAAPIAVPTAQSDYRSRKTQRLDASGSAFDDIPSAALQRKIQALTQPDTLRTSNPRSPSTSSRMENPQVDSFTHLLGISWQCFSSDDKDLGAAIRGWEKYIDNHYSQYVRDSRIILKHKGLNAYLVTSQSPAVACGNQKNPSYLWENDVSIPTPESRQTSDTSPQFYLFNEELSEARLVATDWETCVKRLRCSPIEFAEGSEVVKASDRPCEPSRNNEAGAANMVAKNTEAGSGGLGTEMTMDIDS